MAYRSHGSYIIRIKKIINGKTSEIDWLEYNCKRRVRLLYDAVKERYPEVDIKIVKIVGPRSWE